MSISMPELRLKETVSKAESTIFKNQCASDASAGVKMGYLSMRYRTSDPVVSTARNCWGPPSSLISLVFILGARCR
jgi:hypothetical protein